MLIALIILVAIVELVALVSFLWGADARQSIEDGAPHRI